MNKLREYPIKILLTDLGYNLLYYQEWMLWSEAPIDFWSNKSDTFDIQEWIEMGLNNLNISTLKGILLMRCSI